MRLRDDVADAAPCAVAAARRADTLILRHYWLDGALLALTWRLRAQRRDELFCSQLVALAYHDHDFDLLPGVPLEKVTPGALHASKRLRELRRSDVLAATTLADGPFELDLTDRESRKTVIDRETAIRRGVADRMETALRRDRADLLDTAVLRSYGVASIDKADRFHRYLAALTCAYRDDVAQGRSIDRLFVDALVGEGYVSIPDLLHDPASLEVDRLAALAIEQRLWSAERMAADLEFMRAVKTDLDARLEELRNYAHAYRESFRRTSLATFELLAQTHEGHLRFAERARAATVRTIGVLERALHGGHPER